jgi:hypothetical protein
MKYVRCVPYLNTVARRDSGSHLINVFTSLSLRQYTSIKLNRFVTIPVSAQNWGIGLECQKKSSSDLYKLLCYKPVKTGKETETSFIFFIIAFHDHHPYSTRHATLA